MFSYKYLVLFLSSWLLAGCGSSEEDVVTEQTVRWFEASEQFPLGYAEVKMGLNTTMKVLGEVSTNIASNGHISIHMIWPEGEIMEPGRLYRDSGRQQDIDQVSIFIAPQNETRAIQSIKRARVNKFDDDRGEWRLSKDAVGLLEFFDSKGKSTGWYRSEDANLLEPLGFPVAIHCDQYNHDVDWDAYSDDPKTTIGIGVYKNLGVDELPTCGAIIYWEDGHRIRFRFYRKHLKDAVEIYLKAIALHDSLLINP